MLRIKKIFIVLLFMTGFSMLHALPIGLRMPDSSGVRGEYIDFPVYVDSSLTGHNILSYQLQLSYTTSRLVPDSVISAGTLTQTFGNYSYNLDVPGEITIASAGSTPLSGAGKLIYIRFKMIGTGTAYINFDGENNNYFNEGDPPVSLDNGRIVVSDPPSISVTPNGGVITLGDSRQYSVSGGTPPYLWTVTDPAIAAIDTNGFLTSNWYGQTYVIAEDATGIIDTTDTPLVINPFMLSVADTQVYQGNMVEIPVRTTDLTGLNVTSGYFRLTFNANRLAVVGINKSGTLLDGDVQVNFNSGSGFAEVAFADDQPIEGQGKLLYIQFQSNLNYYGYSTIDIQNILFNQDMYGNENDGSCNVLRLADLNISPNSATLLAGNTQQFSISNGTPPFTWSTTDTTIASINDSGLLLGKSGGIIQVQAEDSIGATGSTSNINIYDTWADIPDTFGTAGNTILLPVNIGDFYSGYDVYSVQAEFEYDTSRITALSVLNSGTLTNNFSFSHNVFDNKVSLAGAGATPFTQGGILFYLEFNIKASGTGGQNAYVNFNEIVLNEGSPNLLTTNGYITVNVNPPGQVQLASPANGATGVSNIVNYCWHALNTATFYDLQVDTTSDFSNPVVNIINIADSCYDITMDYDTEYFWRVSAKNTAGTGPWSDIWSFTTESYVPPVPEKVQLISPDSGSVNISLAPQYCWNAADGADQYDLEVATDTSFSVPFISIINISDTCYNSPQLNYNQLYYWRIRGTNAAWEGPWSNVWSFQTLINSIAEPVSAERPDQYGLKQNYPNPFNPTTKIEFSLPKSGFVEVKVYNNLGEILETLISENLPAGTFSVQWKASDKPSGIYYYSIQSGSFRQIKKMTLVR